MQKVATVWLFNTGITGFVDDAFRERESMLFEKNQNKVKRRVTLVWHPWVVWAPLS